MLHVVHCIGEAVVASFNFVIFTNWLLVSYWELLTFCSSSFTLLQFKW